MLFLPESARYSSLLRLPEGTDVGKAVNDAMKAIEGENEDLRDVLPKTYNRLENDTLFALLKSFSAIPMDIEGDAFGKIYEYFLGKFAMSEGQKGGEFFTPTAAGKTHCGDSGAIPRVHSRPGVWVGRHVCAERALRREP